MHRERACSVAGQADELLPRIRTGGADMVSNQILQNTIDGLKGITRNDLCVIDTEGTVLATTFPEAENFTDSSLAFIESPADSQVVQGCQIGRAHV